MVRNGAGFWVMQKCWANGAKKSFDAQGRSREVFAIFALIIWKQQVTLTERTSEERMHTGKTLQDK